MSKSKAETRSCQVMSEHKLPGGNIVHFISKVGTPPKTFVYAVFVPKEAFVDPSNDWIEKAREI